MPIQASTSLQDGCETCVEVPISAGQITVTNAELGVIAANAGGGPAAPFNLRPIGEGQNVPALTNWAGEASYDPEQVTPSKVSATNPPFSPQVLPTTAVAVGDVLVFSMTQGSRDDTDPNIQTTDRDPTFVNSGTATVGAWTRVTGEFFGYTTGDELDPGYSPELEHEIWWAPVTAAGTVNLSASLPAALNANYGDLWLWNFYVVEGVDPAAPFTQSHVSPLNVVVGNLIDYSVANFDGMIDTNGSGPIIATLPAAPTNPVLVSMAALRVWDRANPNDPRDPAFGVTNNTGQFNVGDEWGGFNTEGTDGTTYFRGVAGTVHQSSAGLQSGLLGAGAGTTTGTPSTLTASMWARFNAGAPKGATAPTQDRHIFNAISLMMLEFNPSTSAPITVTPGVVPTGESIQTQTVDMVLQCNLPPKDTMEVALNVPRIEMIAAPGSAYEVQFWVNGHLAASENIDNSLGSTFPKRKTTSIGTVLTCESAPQTVVDVRIAPGGYVDNAANFVAIDGAVVTCTLASI